MATSTCSGCGAPILWAVTEKGGKMPLDARALVYQVAETLDGSGNPVARATRAEKCYVSNFATCNVAAKFSGKNRKGNS